MRYDLQFAYKRMERVKAERGYDGPAVVCAVYFAPISGYVPTRAAIKYLIQQRDIEALVRADRRHPRAGAVPGACRRRSASALQATQFVWRPRSRRAPWPAPRTRRRGIAAELSTVCAQDLRASAAPPGLH